MDRVDFFGVAYRGVAGAAVAAVLLAGTTAAATTLATSRISSSATGLLTDSGPTFSEVVDSATFLARSHIDPVNSSMGVEVRNETVISNSRATASISDNWSCVTGCSAGAAHNVAVNFTFHVSGTASPTDNFGEVKAGYDLFVGTRDFRFVFDYYQDGSTPSVEAFWDGSTGTTVFPVSLTVDASGNFNFDITGTVSDVICQDPGGCPLNGTGFSDSLTMSADLDADKFPRFMDALNTFSVSMSLVDPGLGFASEEGRALTAASVSVDEPWSVLILGVGLAGLGAARRRRNA